MKTLHEKYINDALSIERKEISAIPKIVGWESPANIALIKYWGKKEGQIPMNPSLSMTLSHAHTRTIIHYRKASAKNGTIHFKFNAREDHPFSERVNTYLENLKTYLPFLNDLDLYIESINNFPHSAGLASSASGMSALALSVVSIEQKLRETPLPEKDFFQKASFMARLGSGSASRSLYGDYVAWGEEEDGSVEYSSPLPGKIHETFFHMHDSIFIVESGNKALSSSKGHERMKDHPYKDARIQQAIENFGAMKETLENGNFNRFAEITEEEAMSLHGLMLSSKRGFFLLNDTTLAIINKIREYREKEKQPVAFTLDAGPNVHILYPSAAKGYVRQFIDKELIPLSPGSQIIHDFTGKGPVKLH